MKKTSVVLFLWAILFGVISSAHADPVYVKVGGTGDGSSWANACGSLQAALNNHPGTEIWVAEGTYTEPSTIMWTEGSKAYGGFKGDEVARDQRNWMDNATILDGEGVRQVLYIGVKDPVDPEGEYLLRRNTRLDGFIVQNGYVNEPYNKNGGGGVYCRRLDGSNVIANCIFQNNEVVAGEEWGAGGALLSVECPGHIIENCVFKNNVAADGNEGSLERGCGAIWFHYSNAHVENCSFEGNRAPRVGAIGINRSPAPSESGFGPPELVIRKCRFIDNEAWRREAGAVKAGFESKVSIEDCVFDGNAAPYDTSSASGGAIFVCDNGTFMTVDRCYFTRNNGHQDAGGILATERAQLIVSNSVFCDNISRNGASIAVTSNRDDPDVPRRHTYANIINCTFLENQRTNDWGAVGVAMWSPNSNNSVHCYILNSIFWNEDTDIRQVRDCHVGYSHLSTGDGIADKGNNVFGADPQLIGGSNPRISATSPCKDSGSASLPSWVEYTLDASIPDHDILSNPRPFGSAIDKGAYEFNSTAPQVVTLEPADANPAYAGLVAFKLTLNTGVGGQSALPEEFSPTNFSLSTTGLGGTPEIVSVSGDGDSRTILVSTGSGTGTLVLNLDNWTGVSSSGDLQGTAPVASSPYFIRPLPVISLNGDAESEVECTSIFTDPGATALDGYGNDLTSEIEVTGMVDTGVTGEYILKYNVTDFLGYEAVEVERTVTVQDTTPPVITRTGKSTITVHLGDAYTDEGATAEDDCDGDLSDDIVVGGDIVDVNTVGSYTITYDVSDAEGNAATQVSRFVNVVDVTEPNVVDVTVESALTVLVEFSKDMTGGAEVLSPAAYVLSGSGKGTFADNPDSVTDVSGHVVRLEWQRPDEMFNGGDIRITVSENMSDIHGNMIQAHFFEDTGGAIGEGPVITLNGGDETLECSLEVFTEAGATAQDDVDGSVEVAIAGDEDVDVTVPGDYVIVYTAVDASGNEATALSRTITVEDMTGPVLTLNGELKVDAECGIEYIDEGASALDACEGDVSGNVYINTDAVNTAVPGEYEISISATDSLGNAAVPLIREVTVVDTTPPVITLKGANPLVLDNGDSFVCPGATATDSCDGVLDPETIDVDASGVNDRLIGDYTVVYTVRDEAENVATEERIVHVRRNACKLKYEVVVTPNPATPGDTITFIAKKLSDSCAVGDLHFLWEKRDDNKAGWTAISTALDDAQFTIDVADFDDAGDYRCTVTDDMTVFNSPAVKVVIGTGTPVAGLIGLALAGALTALAGAAALRKRD